MQAALQQHVDSSISKTINCPAGISFEAFEDIYRQAYDLGLKGCTTYRPNPITGAVLASAGPEAEVQPAERARPVPALDAQRGDIVYMSKPLERDTVLAGYTYKLKWPESDHAIYVTLNDIERDGRRRPFEIFINTRNLEHYAWTVALTRMISAVFRRGGDVSFVADELKAVFDPQGGRWIEGHYVPSLLAAIGEVIETHMRRIGFLAPQDRTELAGHAGIVSEGETAKLPRKRLTVGESVARGRSCPRCASMQFVKQEACWVCLSCGFSRCA
jgi:ribonucleoside-diphosphate reductase alpha chain